MKSLIRGFYSIVLEQPLPYIHAIPILQRFDHARVLMYLDDHPPPHVHVKLRDGRDCTVDLDGLEIKGRITAREIRDQLSWIAANLDFLFDEWRRYNP